MIFFGAYAKAVYYGWWDFDWLDVIFLRKDWKMDGGGERVFRGSHVCKHFTLRPRGWCGRVAAVSSAIDNFTLLCQVKGDPTEWYLSRAGWQETSVLVWVDPILTESWKGRIAKHQRLWGQWGAPWHSGGWVSFLFLLNFFALLRGDNLSTPHLPPSLWTWDMRQLKVGGQPVGQTGQRPDGQVQDTMYRICWGL